MITGAILGGAIILLFVAIVFLWGSNSVLRQQITPLVTERNNLQAQIKAIQDAAQRNFFVGFTNEQIEQLAVKVGASIRDMFSAQPVTIH